MAKENRKFWGVGLGYKYAPESCFVTELQRNGTYRKVNVDLSGSMCGYYMAIGETEKASAEVKRIMRALRKGRKRVVTFGFFIKGSQTQYVYCKDPVMLAGEYNMANKLSVFKRYKQYLQDSDCKYHTSTSAKLDGRYNIESVEKEYAEVDLSRPLKIYVNYV